MVFMEAKIGANRDPFIDLESGTGAVVDEGGVRGFGGVEEERRKKKKGSNKKPPRPPKSPSLDAADQKLIREISELAMLKRARMERMKALKKMKNAKTAAPGGNLCALLTTIVFCILIIWQAGFFSRGSSTVNFQGSPESSVGPQAGLISVQFYRNNSTESPHGSNSVSPNNVEQRSGVDEEEDGSRNRMVG